MANDRPWGARRASEPPVLRDDRVRVWFTACVLFTMAVLSGGCLALIAGFVPGPLQEPTLFACIFAGIVGVAGAFAPIVLGIRCRNCARRIFSAPARHSCTRRPPIRFYCPACDVEWDTGLWWGEE